MSLYVNKYPGGWRVIEETYKDGRRSQKTIPRESYVSLGINPSWTIDEARAKITSINLENTLCRQKVAVARRVVEIRTNESIFTPDTKVRAFLERLAESSFGSLRHQKKLISHWQYLNRMLTELRIHPIQYYDNKERIYKYFIEKCSSPDYATKLLRILNAWGEFICRDQQQFFKPVPSPRGLIRSKIEESYLDSNKVKNESDPLTPELLDSVYTLLNSYNYNWLLVTVWFGLRPNEVDSKKFKVEIINGIQVLSVYQSKLTSVSRDKRWKYIPILYPEQKKCLSVLNECKRPLMKTLRRIFKQRITTYGGRKGFTDLMWDRNHTVEDVSMWMGHQSIETTYRKYRNRKRVSWKTG